MDLEKIIRFLRSLKKKKGYYYQPLFLIILDAYYVFAGANNNTVFKCFAKLYRIFWENNCKVFKDNKV